MKIFIWCLAFSLGQVNTLQDPPVVHLHAKSNTIPFSFGGKLLELVNAPAVVFLPVQPPKTDSEGIPWSVEVKNLGPQPVTVDYDKVRSVRISVGQTIRISSDGQRYSVER